MILSVLYLLLFSSLFSIIACYEDDTNSSSPHWENLECEVGHKYLFSEVLLNWEDSRVECDLYGGWIVDVKDVQEENCLMRHAMKTDGLTDYFYWTDATEGDGVWMHSSTGEEVAWFGRKPFWCSSGSHSNGGNAMMIAFDKHRNYNGRWC